MRIVGGKWRGLAVEAPQGRGTTRPTTDRNRERFASMILSAAGLDLSGMAVLDAFAGSGAMGFELVSRGAASATFIDLDRGAVSRIRRTAEKSLRADPCEWRVVAGDAVALAEQGRVPGGPFGVVFLDPPYAVAADRVRALVDALIATGQVRPGAIVVYEHASKAAGIAGGALELQKSKNQGVTTVDLMVLRAPDDAGGPASQNETEEDEPNE
ncbi:RsmD family RNA methyltransferase [Paratractidigestivibacter sp.]|uniref:RsmD family RNA methyltransferase n=1 Tax=Paratractidigestivibacter sp. TaxID=2847316 RepID=UPI002ABDDF10|nr:RsmD family RNA methyltransferase [Paratractidigestivibacter sp.]